MKKRIKGAQGISRNSGKWAESTREWLAAESLGNTTVPGTLTKTHWSTRRPASGRSVSLRLHYVFFASPKHKSNFHEVNTVMKHYFQHQTLSSMDKLSKYVLVYGCPRIRRCCLYASIYLHLKRWCRTHCGLLVPVTDTHTNVMSTSAALTFHHQELISPTAIFDTKLH